MPALQLLHYSIGPRPRRRAGHVEATGEKGGVNVWGRLAPRPRPPRIEGGVIPGRHAQAAVVHLEHIAGQLPRGPFARSSLSYSCRTRISASAHTSPASSATASTSLKARWPIVLAIRCAIIVMGGEHTGKFIAYYRVSTQRQGRSGLGLEAQRRAVLDHLNGGNWRIVAEFTEIESGKRKDRPKLAEALAACRVHGAKLVIAKLDRLARNVAFVSSLMEAGVDFEAVDFPQANRLTIHILAAVAEHEARMISERTKAALAAAKRRGVALGGIRDGHVPFTAKVRALGVKARAANVARRAADMAPIIAELQAAGVHSRSAIAAELNARAIPTMSGTGRWQATSVTRLLARLPAD